MLPPVRSRPAPRAPIGTSKFGRERSLQRRRREFISPTEDRVCFFLTRTSSRITFRYEFISPTVCDSVTIILPLVASDIAAVMRGTLFVSIRTGREGLDIISRRGPTICRVSGRVARVVSGILPFFRGPNDVSSLGLPSMVTRLFSCCSVVPGYVSEFGAQVRHVSVGERRGNDS